MRARLAAIPAALLLGLLAASPRAASGTLGGTIAYARVLPNGGSELHALKPDGSGDRLLTKLATSKDFWPELAWSPDGSELAFSSDHEASRSFYGSDVYAAKADGSGLRRITNSPDAGALTKYPKGSVTVNVQVLAPGSANAPGGGPFLVYVEGASAPQAVTASRKLRFDNVAVFAGRAQFVVAVRGLYRWFNAGVGAPLKAGGVTDLGTLTIAGEGLREVGASDFSWRADGSALLYRFGECCLYKIASQPKEKDVGSSILKTAGFASWVRYAPVAAKAAQFIYADWDVLSGTSVLLASEGQEHGQPVPLPAGGGRVLDLQWLPDASGFLYSQEGMDEYGLTVANSNLYEYDLARHTARKLTSFTGEYAYRLSPSPNGQWIAFEHSADGKQLDGLWLVGRDGSNPYPVLQGKGVGRPAWRK